MTSIPPLDTGELYRILAESASDAIVTIDGESIVLSINPAGEALFGYSAAELLGTSLIRVMPERYQPAHRAGMTHYLKTGKRRIPWKAVQLSILTKAGHEIPVEISFGEFASAGRHIFSAVLRDVSDRVAAEATLAANAEQLQGQAVELERQVEEAQAVSEELEQANEELHQMNVALEMARADAEAAVARMRSQEAEYRALANSMPTLAWMAKPDGWIFWYNERWYEYTGTAPVDMEGWGWQRVHDPQTLPHVLELWSASIKTGEPFEMTFPLRGADGSFRPFLTRVFPLRGAHNEIVRWFGTNTDVSHERAARLAAESATERIRRLQSLTALLARAQTLHDIASAVVHEAVEATGAHTGMVALRDGDTGDAVLLDEMGLPDSLRSDYARFPISRDSPTAECLRTNAAIFVGMPGGQNGLLARYPALRDVWDAVGRSAVASVPIRLHDEAVAAMSFTFAEPQMFDAEDQDFFFALAAQAAQAIARVHAFDAERSERRRSESIVEAITDGFATFDPELHFTYVNARAASMFGVAKSDLQGRDITAMNQASDSPFLHLLRKVIAERAPGELEAFGSIMGRWLALRAYPSEDGGVIVYFQDISNRRRQQDASLFLAEASRLLTSSPGYEVALRNLARVAIPKLGEWCAIHLVDSENNRGVPKLTRVALV
nr:PAS domain S-box protein [Chthoniobacterales bacterium]